MEQKLNIAEILKDKPVELKLYSSTFGYIKFNGVHKDRVYFSSEDTNVHSVKPNGKMYDNGECIIFPSKEMRDWEKFSWKKGDVLTNSSGFKVFFDKWVNENYTKFLGKIKVLGDSHYYYYDTAYYILASKKETLEFIKSVEEINNGKPNLKTLEIEKGQPEFKDGDIVVAEEDNYYDKVIFIAAIKDTIVSKVIINVRYEDYEVHYNEYRFGHNRSLRLATDSEKRQLFDALEKRGKAWDAEKKQIVDLKLKWIPKPFEKIIALDPTKKIWTIDFFSYKFHDRYFGLSGYSWDECLPYNEETAKLIGTTNNVEG